MKYIDESFTPAEGLERAVKLLKQRNFEASVLPRDLSAEGLGEEKLWTYSLFMSSDVQQL